MGEIVASCAVWIAGNPIPDGSTGDRDAPVAVTGLVIRWGRDNTTDQPDPATATLSILDRGGGTVRTEQLVALGASVTVEATVAGRGAVIVFAGRITDLELEYDELGGSICRVIAADLAADLANRFVGAEPWPSETLAARASRILAGAGITGVTVEVDPRPAALPVSRADVDRQAAAGLLTDLARSGTAVLWVVVPASTAVPGLRIEDPAARPSMRALAQSLPSLLWRITDTAGLSYTVSSSALLRPPISWSRALGDLITRVTVRWLDQTTSPDVTERSVILTDPGSELAYGARGLSVGTTLASQAAANEAASVWMAGHRPSVNWRVAGLTWDLGHTPVSDAAADLAVALLDNSRRIGLPVVIDELPWWVPQGAQAGAYIEGGTYRYDDGRWVFALDGVPATGTGGSLAYAQTDLSMRYVDIDPTITFLDMIGVGPRSDTGPAWSSAPAGKHWNSYPAGTDWSEVTV